MARAGRWLAGMAVVAVAGWITAVETSTKRHIPLWPEWVFVGMFVVGAALWLIGRGWRVTDGEAKKVSKVTDTVVDARGGEHVVGVQVNDPTEFQNTTIRATGDERTRTITGLLIGAPSAPWEPVASPPAPSIIPKVRASMECPNCHSVIGMAVGVDACPTCGEPMP